MTQKTTTHDNDDDVTAPEPKTKATVQRTRRAIGGGAFLVVFGLAFVGSGPSDVGTALTLIGLALMIYGIHSFGRLGPD